MVFSLEDGPDVLQTSAGLNATQVAIRGLGIYIDKHFGAIGGFSTRRRSNEFVTLLPYSDSTETESILKDFSKNFAEMNIHDVWPGARRQTRSEECIEFKVLAGIAQGQPAADIDSIIENSQIQTDEIGRLRCDGRR